MTLNLPGIDKPTEDLKLQNILGDSNPDNQSVQLSGLPPTDNVYTQENNSPNSSFPIGEIKGYNPYDKLQGEIDNGFPMANIPIVEKFFTPEPKQSYQTPSAPDWKTMFPDIRNSRKDNIDLSPNNPWLAYFPNPGSMRVASPLLLSKAMEWENQNYQNQISNIKAQQTADYNDRMLQHQNDVNDRIVEQNRTTNAYNQYKDMAELNFKKEQERNKIQTAEDKLNADQLNQNDIDDIAGIISDYDVSNSDGTINPDKVNQRANLEYRFNIALKLGSKKAVQKILEDLGKTMPKTLNQSVEGKNQATIDKTETQTDALKADQLTDDDLSNLRLNYINFQAATPEAKTVKDAIIATIDSAKPGSSAKELRKTISDIVKKGVIPPAESEGKKKIDELRADLLTAQINLTRIKGAKLSTGGGISGMKAGDYAKLVKGLYQADMTRKGGRYDSLNQTWSFPDGQKPPSLNDWAAANLDAKHYQAFVNDTGFKDNDPDNGTTTKDPVPYKQNQSYTQQDWNIGKQISDQAGGPGLALISLYRNGTIKVGDKTSTVLTARYNGAKGTKYTPQQFYDKFIAHKK